MSSFSGDFLCRFLRRKFAMERGWNICSFWYNEPTVIFLLIRNPLRNSQSPDRNILRISRKVSFFAYFWLFLMSGTVQFFDMQFSPPKCTSYLYASTSYQKLEESDMVIWPSCFEIYRMVWKNRLLGLWPANNSETRDFHVRFQRIELMAMFILISENHKSLVGKFRDVSWIIWCFAIFI